MTASKFKVGQRVKFTFKGVLGVWMTGEGEIVTIDDSVFYPYVVNPDPATVKSDLPPELGWQEGDGALDMDEEELEAI